MSSPLVTQFRRGGISRDVRLTAASGALPLSPADQVELLFLLTRDRDEEVNRDARSSLEQLDQTALVSVLKEESTSVDVLAFFGAQASSDEVQQALVRNASTPDETVAILVPKLNETNLEFVVVNQTRLLRHTTIIAALEANENLNFDQGRRINELKFDFKLDRPAEEAQPPPPPEPQALQKLDLGVGPADEEEPPPRSTEEAAERYGVSDDEESTEEEQAKKKSLLAELATMSAAQKMMKALKGEREARMMLIRDRNRTVWSAVLSSPKMNDADAEQIAKMRNVAPDVLREIARNRQFVKRYNVAHELVKNPKTPQAVSSKLMARLKDRDLKRLARDRNVSEMVRRLAEKRMRSSK